jgi:hypothetical protein
MPSPFSPLPSHTLPLALPPKARDAALSLLQSHQRDRTNTARDRALSLYTLSLFSFLILSLLYGGDTLGSTGLSLPLLLSLYHLGITVALSLYLHAVGEKEPYTLW